MSKRTTLVLGVIAAGLLAFIFLYERHTLSTGQLEGRRRELIQSFVRSEVSRIVIEREEVEDEDDFPDWRLTAPVAAAADADAVDSLVGALEWAFPRRTIRDVGPEDLRTFGLAEPRLTASFTVANESVPILFGAEDPQGGGVYLRLEDPTVVHIVGQDLLEALDHDAGHFRSKELFGELLVERATGLTLGPPGDGEGGEPVSAVLRDGRWWLTEPVETYASGSALRDLLSKLSELRAARFVAETVDDAASFGLATASLDIVVVRERQNAGDGPAVEQAHILVGGPCGGHPDERHVRVDEGPLVCVEAASLDGLAVSAERLRETRVITSRDDAVEQVELRSGGRTVVLRRDEDAWRMEVGEGATTDAEPEAVADLLGALRRAQAETFLPADDATLAAQGLRSPAATLSLSLGDDGPPEVVHLGRVAEGWAYLRRGDEPAVLRVEDGVATRFDPSPLPFRSRRLIAADADDLAALRLEGTGRATGAERVERDGAGYRLLAPVVAEADRRAVRELAGAVSELTALRWVAERAAPEHGLSSPRIILTARFEPSGEHEHGEEEGDGEEVEPESREHTLRIGAPTGDGAFARLDAGPAVFVVSEELVRDASEPLIARGLLGTDTDHVAGVRMTRGEGEVAVERQGSRFVAADGSPADPQRTRDLIGRLAALRAVRAAYGPPAADQGFDPPRARVRVTRVARAPEPHEYTFLVGARSGEGADALVHVRREDLAVGFEVPADAAQVFLDYEP